MSGQHWRAWWRFRAAPRPAERLVVYSQGRGDWPHLGPVVRALAEREDLNLAYVTSSSDDPGLQMGHPRVPTYEIGSGFVRTLLHNTAKAGVWLTTLPDLNRFHLKRSAQVGCYAYLHHALVSCHMVYRPGAFDDFDVMLCAGPHHVSETRAEEAVRGLRPKQLVAHGYGRLDDLRAAAARERPVPGTVLLAPSWGPHGLMECHLEATVMALLATAQRVIIRPHPRSLQLRPDLRPRLQALCAAQPALIWDDAVESNGTLLQAEVMVSDWSGAAFEFALGCQRPVLFVDTPRKVNNPAYADWGLTPVEVGARSQLGRVVALNELPLLAAHLRALREDTPAWQGRLASLQQQWVFNSGRSAQVAADWLARRLLQPSRP